MHAVVRTSSDLFEFVTKLDGTLNMLFLYFNFLETKALPFSLYYFPHQPTSCELTVAEECAIRIRIIINWNGER